MSSICTTMYCFCFNFASAFSTGEGDVVLTLIARNEQSLRLFYNLNIFGARMAFLLNDLLIFDSERNVLVSFKNFT